MTSEEKIEYYNKAIAKGHFLIEEAKRKFVNKVKHFKDSIKENEEAKARVVQEEIARQQLEKTMEG